MKFKFKLQSLLNVKTKLEEAQKVQYGKAIKTLEIEKDNLNILYEKKAYNIAKMRDNITKGISPTYIQTVNNFIKQIKVSIEEQKDIVKRAEQTLEEEKDKLLLAMREKKMLESLEEKEKEKHRIDILMKEQKNVDEIVSYKYNKV